MIVLWLKAAKIVPVHPPESTMVVVPILEQFCHYKGAA
jgi:hypothetical protein